MSTETETTVVDLKSNAVHSVFSTPAAEAPKEPVAEVEAEETENAESEEASAASDGDDSTAHPKKNRGVGKRINELTREKYEAIRRAEDAERKLEEFKSQPVKHNPQAQATAEPTLDQFDYDYEKYAKAVGRWEAQQILAERDRKQAEEKDQEYRQTRANDLQARIDAYAEQDPEGWSEALAAPVRLTQTMMEAVSESELAPQIGVYLARNLDEADAISRMSTVAQIRAIAKIEAKLEGAPTAKASTPPKKLTSAPPPAKTLSGGRTAIKNLDSPDISTEDRIAAWRAQKLSR